MQVAKIVSEQVTNKYHLTPKAVMRAIGIVGRNEIRALPSGSYAVKSQTRLDVEHHVNPKYEECNCEAGKQGVVCVHLIAFLLLRAQWEYARQEAVKTLEARVALISRPARTEWREELE